MMTLDVETFLAGCSVRELEEIVSEIFAPSNGGPLAHLYDSDPHFRAWLEASAKAGDAWDASYNDRQRAFEPFEKG